MATRFVGTPLSAEFPLSNAAQLLLVNTRPVLAYDDGATNETAYWTFVAPQGLTGAITVLVYYMMYSATGSVNVRWGAQIEAVTPDDALDLDASTSFDTAVEAHEQVPGTAGYMSVLSLSMSTADSIAAGDLVRLSVYRDSSDSNDTAGGDAYLLAGNCVMPRRRM